MRDLLRSCSTIALSILLAAGVIPATAGSALAAEVSDETAPTVQPGAVVIDEITNGGVHGGADGFFELRNVSTAEVELTGWSVYRCDGEGLRAKASRPEVDLSGIVLAPGARFTATHMGWHGVTQDAVFTQTLDPEGLGLVLLDPEGRVADRVAVYANGPQPTQSECGTGPNLPATLAFALEESWQRTPAGWLRARATPGEANAAGTRAETSASIRIDEVAAAGPGGHGDDVVELRNVGTKAQRLDGWRLYRCAATGVLTAATVHQTFAPGTMLEPGERLVIGGPDYTGEADLRSETSLADLVSGVLLVTSEGTRVDGVTVSSRGDTACQAG